MALVSEEVQPWTDLGKEGLELSLDSVVGVYLNVALDQRRNWRPELVQGLREKNRREHCGEVAEANSVVPGA